MGMVGMEREGCGRLLGIECVEREGEGLWLVQVEGSDSKQLEMSVQCEQFISTFDPPLHAPCRKKWRVYDGSYYLCL